MKIAVLGATGATGRQVIAALAPGPLAKHGAEVMASDGSGKWRVLDGDGSFSVRSRIAPLRQTAPQPLLA